MNTLKFIFESSSTSPMNILEQLDKRSKPFVVALALLLVILQSSLDIWAGPDYSFFLFYLLPISLVSWLVGKRAGVFISLASVAGYFVTETLTDHFYLQPYAPYFNAVARFGAFLFVTYFVSALRRSLEHERELARTDALTGVINRRSFVETASQEINRARRNRQPFTVAYMDIDDFKEINDHFGHSVGDNLLRTVTQTMKENVREMDLIARLGGDEFVIFMPETGQEAAQVVIERVRQHIMDVMRAHQWPVTFSIGVVTWTTPPRTVDLMIKHADDTMYNVKNNGKNRISHTNISGEPMRAI